MSTPSSSFDLSTVGTSITSALTASGFWDSIGVVLGAGLTVMLVFWGSPKLVTLFKKIANK